MHLEVIKIMRSTDIESVGKDTIEVHFSPCFIEKYFDCCERWKG